MLRKLILFFMATALAVTSCTQPHYVILDDDIGSSTDDLIALKMAFNYQDEGIIKILGIMVDRPGEHLTQYHQQFDAFYGKGNIPLGTVRDFPREDPYKFIPYAEEEVVPQFMKDIDVKPYDEIPNADDLYIEILRKARPNSVDIISLGFLTNIARLLARQPDLVASKVRNLYIMGASIKDGQYRSYNFTCDPAAANYVFNNWPGEILVSPAEAGFLIDYAKEDIFEDYSLDSPIGYAYAHTNTDTGQKMWDPLPVIQCAEGNTNLIESDRLGCKVYESGATEFYLKPDGKIRLYMIDEVGAEYFYDKMRQHSDLKYKK